MIIYLKIYCAIGKTMNARNLFPWSVTIYLEIFSWKEHGCTNGDMLNIH